MVQTVEFITINGKNSRWTMLEARMNVDRSHFGLVWFNGGLFAVGGLEKAASAELLKDADPEGKWNEHVRMERRLSGDLVFL